MNNHHPVAGAFTLFGFTRDPRRPSWIAEKLGVKLRTFPAGSAGQFFFFTSDGESFEADDVVIIKVGFLRSSARSPLNAVQFYQQNLAAPGFIQTDRFSGNGLVIAISKDEPRFSAFETLLSAPQLNIYETPDEILCSDALGCLTRLLKDCEPDPSILPQHFLFRTVQGAFSYYRGVRRLPAGEMLRWEDGCSKLERVRSLDSAGGDPRQVRDSQQAVALIEETLQGVVNDYIEQAGKMGSDYVNLLSGGVDLSLIQSMLNSHDSHPFARSLSYNIRVPSFEFEVDYARQASQIFKTQHSFIDIFPGDYPGLLTRSVALLSQPPILETEVNLLAIVEYARSVRLPARYFFTGLAADSMLGEKDTPKLANLLIWQKLPFAAALLKAIGLGLAPFTSRAHTFALGSSLLAGERDPGSYYAGENYFRTYISEDYLNLARKCFGDRALKEALQYRRDLAAGYARDLHARPYLEKVHLIDLLTDTYEIAVQRRQLFLGGRFDHIDPFMDEDVLRAVLSIHPSIRYIRRMQPKYLLKELVEQRTGAPIGYRRKGASAATEDILSWAASGPLREMVAEIDRPGYLSQADFDHLCQHPNYFLWPLLTYDLFCKAISQPV